MVTKNCKVQTNDDIVKFSYNTYIKKKNQDILFDFLIFLNG